MIHTHSKSHRDEIDFVPTALAVRSVLISTNIVCLTALFYTNTISLNETHVISKNTNDRNSGGGIKSAQKLKTHERNTHGFCIVEIIIS